MLSVLFRRDILPLESAGLYEKTACDHSRKFQDVLLGEGAMQVFPMNKNWIGGRGYGFVCGARENLCWMAEVAIQGGKFGDLGPSDVCDSRGD